MPVSANARAALPPMMLKGVEWKRKAAQWIHEVNKGHIPCTGRVTLTPNSNTTTVNDMRAGPTSCIHFMPVTPNAGMEATNLVVIGQGKKFFTIAHTNNGLDDRTFIYSITG